MTQTAPRRSATRIRYMGNKAALAARVIGHADILRPHVPLVDLFGGMCSIAGAAAPTGRAVWVNDVQRYATLAARCLIKASSGPPDAAALRAQLASRYDENVSALESRFEYELRWERAALQSTSVAALQAMDAAWRHAADDPVVAEEVRALRRCPARPYRLATMTFACGYFGLRQAVEVDSLRYAIDDARTEGLLSSVQSRWARLALLQTASMIAAAPGHFAQYLKARTPDGARRVQTIRKRSALEVFYEAVANLRPYGTTRWRASNRVLEGDALDVCAKADRADLQPALFYADPPYSKDHYSRYYHVLETLERYDYPDAVGIGRYRPDRFATRFSVASEVLGATNEMLSGIAARDGAVLFSYPSTGLLTRRLGVDLSELLHGHFRQVATVITEPTRHSTLGAGHGESSTAATEYVLYAR